MEKNLEERIKDLEKELKLLRENKEKTENPTSFCISCKEKGEHMDCLSVYDKQEKYITPPPQKIYICTYCNKCKLVSVYTRPITINRNENFVFPCGTSPFAV